VRDVEALVAAIMVDAPLAELIAITDRIAAAVDHWDEIPASDRSPSCARRSI
jgi:hypothetical protein